jgi:hypothetical protein
MTQPERWFTRGILDLPAAARLAHCSVRRLRRLARTGRLPFRAQRGPAWWEVDEGSFRDWLSTRPITDKEKA